MPGVKRERQKLNRAICLEVVCLLVEMPVRIRIMFIGKFVHA